MSDYVTHWLLFHELLAIEWSVVIKQIILEDIQNYNASLEATLMVIASARVPNCNSSSEIL